MINYVRIQTCSRWANGNKRKNAILCRIVLMFSSQHCKLSKRSVLLVVVLVVVIWWYQDVGCLVVVVFWVDVVLLSQAHYSCSWTSSSSMRLPPGQSSSCLQPHNLLDLGPIQCLGAQLSFLSTLPIFRSFSLNKKGFFECAYARISSVLFKNSNFNSTDIIFNCCIYSVRPQLVGEFDDANNFIQSDRNMRFKSKVWVTIYGSITIKVIR